MKRLGISNMTLQRLINDGRLRAAARSGPFRSSVQGFAPEDVQKVKEQEKRLAALVMADRGCVILGIPRSTFERLVRKGLLQAAEQLGGRRPQGIRHYFDPKALRALRAAAWMVEVRSRAQRCQWQQRARMRDQGARTA